MTTEQLNSITASLTQDESKFECMNEILHSKIFKNLREQILLEYPQIMLALNPDDFTTICLAIFQSGFQHGRRWQETQQLEDLVR